MPGTPQNRDDLLRLDQNCPNRHQSLGKGKGGTYRPTRWATPNFEAIREPIYLNITLCIYHSIYQSQLAPGRHVILLQYKNVMWSLSRPFHTAKGVPETVLSTKKKHLKTLKCL